MRGDEERGNTEDKREEGRCRLVLPSKSSRVYPVRNDTGQAKPLREGRKYRTTEAQRHGDSLRCRCGRCAAAVKK